LVNYWIGVENVDLVFLTSIVGIAVRFGLLPSLFASVVSALCYNFFFLPPIYTFTIADPHNIAAFALFSRFPRRGPRPFAGGNGASPGAHHRVALFLQPQARGRRHAR
jgi:uncharacterized protein DUF4118